MEAIHCGYESLSSDDVVSTINNIISVHWLDTLLLHSNISQVPYTLDRRVSNTKLNLLYKRSELSLVVFYISLLLDIFS